MISSVNLKEFNLKEDNVAHVVLAKEVSEQSYKAKLTDLSMYLYVKNICELQGITVKDFIFKSSNQMSTSLINEHGSFIEKTRFNVNLH